MDSKSLSPSIAVFTGSRSEYGLLRSLIKAISHEPDLSLQLIVGGSHLSQSLGFTVNEIEHDGFLPSALIPISHDTNNLQSMATLTSEALFGTGQALEELKPDLLILLGDRFETFAAASASHLLGIPVVHIHGGETTIGAIDDRLRHAITQLSSWHFTSADVYRQRVIAMGHPSQNVFNVGPMVIDGLINSTDISRHEFESRFNYRFGARNLLVTYHPETLSSDFGISSFEVFLDALACMDCHILFTQPNADTGSTKIRDLISCFVSNHNERSWFVDSLGHENYLHALRLFEAMAGNSSSGIIEAPLLGMPVLNLGNRQLGRYRFGTVIDVSPQPNLSLLALDTVLELVCVQLGLV